jgi:hypothetical protein
MCAANRQLLATQLAVGSQFAQLRAAPGVHAGST